MAQLEIQQIHLMDLMHLRFSLRQTTTGVIRIKQLVKLALSRNFWFVEFDVS